MKTRKNSEILERRNLKCTKTRVTQIVASSTSTWLALTKRTNPQAWWPMNLLSILRVITKTKAESFLWGATSGSLFQNCQIATVNVQVYQSGRTEKYCVWWFKSKSVFFSVFTSNISSQNFARLGLVFLYTWHQVLLYFLFAVKQII